MINMYKDTEKYNEEEKEKDSDAIIEYLKSFPDK